ncbi:beta-glucosidase 1B [Microbotryum lychnidis-dioicae p1A1 Lamole]|uniref:beta-glucosidase n=1 Tax=Microbotryum lychnidis-dioicae (strain p1A1 Lamole / MvSl-1064) TaxID=683840 RepID=U5HJA5_USTV1|nr:beta-glucosidase 1B [Microbotryum lychnidis-dioicae p1A1 Lamole]|eukprot:KDE02348.1 beta-glucosidase 1B [Microbotryum lychnidis-dioicae p1A1 Lamole]
MPHSSAPLALPRGFRHGFATASYQIEGSVDVDGRGSTVWDDMCQRKNEDGSLKVVDGTDGSLATDSYRRYSEDIALMKSYGANCYRFSIAWARIIPLGGASDPVNPLGIKFYSDLIDELLANGIEPLVTLYHWDTPSALQERYNGWLDGEQITRDFVNYARVCFDAFGDRVKCWITLNEPYCESILGHLLGIHAPGRTSNRAQSAVGDSVHEPWIAGHNQILAHAHVSDLYNKQYRHRAIGGRGQISIALNGDWNEPYDQEPATIAAAQRANEAWVAWFADPIYLGRDYPASLRAQLGSRLPQFTSAELDLLKANIPEFYGMNHYTTNLVKPLSEPADALNYNGNVSLHHTYPDTGKLIGTPSQCSWHFNVPWGFRKLLGWIWDRYHVPIVVTENGYPVTDENNFSLQKAIDDTERCNFYESYLNEMEKAMLLDGVDVRGYCAWSLLDNFEWAEGYIPRFGCTHVDYKTMKRTPKKSSKVIREWFAAREAKGSSSTASMIPSSVVNLMKNSNFEVSAEAVIA